MTHPSEEMIAAAAPVAEAIRPRAQVQREHAIERAVLRLQEGLDYIPLRSPDGTVWRVRISNDGVLSMHRLNVTDGA